jgi:hypothetical protein
MEDEKDVQTDAPAEPVVEEAEQVEVEQPEATTGTDGDETPDGDESTADTEPKKPAKGVQKRLDELTRLRKDAERDRDHWRELAMRQTQPVPQAEPQQAAPPRQDQFDSYEDFEAARIEYAVEQRLKTAREIEQRESALRSFQGRVEAVRDKLPDYDLYVGDPTLTITPLMAEVIRESEVGPEVAYHLGKNRSEAQRIAALPPHRQAAELGRLEAKLSMEQSPPNPNPRPNPRNVPPAPPQTVAGLSAGLTKAPDDMSMAEYISWRTQQDKT